jgi:hypothetical protein
MFLFAFACMVIASSTIGTIIGQYIKEMIDRQIMNHRMNLNSRYLEKRRAERDELAKRRRPRES